MSATGLQIAGFAIGIVGFLSTLTGLYTFIARILRETVQADTNASYSDPSIMGYFAAERLRVWQYMLTLRQRYTRVPDIPSLEAMLKMGDDGFFSSKAFDGAGARSGTRMAGWVWLYGAIVDGFEVPVQADKLLSVGESLKGALARSKSCDRRRSDTGVARDLVPCIRTHADWKSEFVGESVSERKGKTRRRRAQKSEGSAIDSTRSAVEDVETKHYTWLICSKPHLKISREELCGLTISLGATLKWDAHSSSFIGAGAFGIDITLHYLEREAFWRASIEQSTRRYDQRSSKGNGYSVMAAKHMACGSLPFGRANVGDFGFVKSIYVSEQILEAIEEGRGIYDSPTYQYAGEIEYLRRLPTSRYTQPWPHCGFSRRGKMDQIRDERDEMIVGSWSEAVCGIAFGGLVPQTTATLKRAVQFTTRGLCTIAESDEDIALLGKGTVVEEASSTCENALEYLENLFHMQAPSLELFGSWVADRYKGADADYVLRIEDTRDAAAAFGRYQALLERVVALCVFEPSEASTTAATGRIAAEMGSSAAVDVVFGEMTMLMKRSYEEALKRERVRIEGRASAALSHEALSAKLGEVLSRIARNISFDENCVVPLKYCTWIAACIIAAWANNVPVVSLACSQSRSESMVDDCSDCNRVVTMADLPGVITLG